MKKTLICMLALVIVAACGVAMAANTSPPQTTTGVVIDVFSIEMQHGITGVVASDIVVATIDSDAALVTEANTTALTSSNQTMTANNVSGTVYSGNNEVNLANEPKETRPVITDRVALAPGNTTAHNDLTTSTKTAAKTPQVVNTCRMQV